MFAGQGVGPRRLLLPGGWGTGPTVSPPLCKACFCGQVARLVFALRISAEGAGPALAAVGGRTYRGGAAEHARGGLGFCHHGQGRDCVLGEGGFCGHWGYYWGGILCLLVGRAVC